MNDELLTEVGFLADEPGETTLGVSEKKLLANRKNAKKSTGPRTPRGKSYSRRNAIRHGLFVRERMAFRRLGEDPLQYTQLRRDLCRYFQPMGRAEELEVELIADCWWRLARVRRYENAVAHNAIGSEAASKLQDQIGAFRRRTANEQAVIDGVERLKDEIRATWKVPSDLKDKFLALTPDEALWESAKSLAETRLREEELSYRQSSSASEVLLEDSFPPQEELECCRALETLSAIGIILNVISGTTNSLAVDVILSEHILPDRKALDRILPCEAALERSLQRSMDRLEQLQRRRKGETVLPPVRVRLARES